jgi:hypothetical protein
MCTSGTVLTQARSVLKMNVVYFYVDGAKPSAADPDICARKQAAETAQAGHAYSASEWSDLIVRARLVHGLPKSSDP